MTEQEKQTGREAQMSNIKAAMNVAETVRSTLGPAGMDKLLTNGNHHIVTNDGVTVLRELDTAHPGAQMMVEASQTQEAVCKDGTTSVVVLAGQMLALSQGLLMRGIHPRVILRSFQTGKNLALEHLEPQDIDILDAAKTALRGKAAESELDYAAELCLQACKKADGNLDHIKVITQAGGALSDSYVQDGLVINKEFANDVDDTNISGNINVLLLNGGLEGYDLSEVQMQIENMQQLHELKQSELSMLSEVAALVAGAVGPQGVVFVRDSVHEAVAHYLAQQGIPIVTRLQQSDMESLSRLLKVPIYHRITEVEEPIMAVDASVKQERIGDLDFVTVSGAGEATCLVVRGATRQTIEEYERAFDDAIGVTCLAMKDSSKGFPGGGASFSAASMTVRTHASNQPNMTARERMCLEAYADALEIIPAAIANNAGMDPLDVVMELRSAENGIGLYIDDRGVGDICNTLEKGVVEPESLVKQVISSATEVATAILRIDDIMAMKDANNGMA